METLVVGLDGATWRRLNPLLDDGRLPNIESLITEGASGILESTDPPLTPPAWTSISTGVSPGTHGIYDFFEIDPETYDLSPVDYARMSEPAIWDVFEHEDQSIGVVNFPLAYPPRKVGSFFVSGPPVHESESIAYPTEIEEILSAVDYRVDPERRPGDGAEAFYDEIRDLTAAQVEAIHLLLERDDPELLWTVFMGIDRIQHYLWDEQIDGENAVNQFYEYIDDVVGELLDAIDENVTVCLLSDHGFRRIDGTVNINKLLKEWGYLDWATEDPTNSISQCLVDSAWTAMTSLPRPIKRVLRKNVPTGVITQVREKTTQTRQALSKFIHWEGTTAFAIGNGGGVYINTDEFGDGIVSNDEYEAIREELIDRFKTVKIPEAETTVFEAVVRGEHLYPISDGRTPDIVLQPRNYRYTMNANLADERFSPPGARIADHEKDGILILSGEHVDNVGLRCKARDITPTLLYRHGLPLVDSMEGSVCFEAFTDEFTADRAVRTMPRFTPTTVDGTIDQEKAEERLKNLGYL